MNGSTDPVELLAAAIGWTRRALEVAATADPRLPTPCHTWDLGQLLDHMADGLDAFTEASQGLVAVPSQPVSGVAVDDLCIKACALLGAWSTSAADSVRIHDAALSADVLLHAAAVEIAVHGWDVARACGTGDVLPAQLARALLPAAHLLVDSNDRRHRFAPIRQVNADASPAECLLALLGRDPQWNLVP